MEDAERQRGGPATLRCVAATGTVTEAELASSSRAGASVLSGVVVLGTGLMAPGIAAAAARSGAQVLVVGRSHQKAETAAAHARELTELTAGGRIAAGRFDLTSFQNAQLVLETIVEDETAKANVLSRVERWVSDDTVLATNTSSISIQRLAGALQKPQRFGGLHFLNPAHLTRPVEVIRGPHTEPRTTDELTSFATAMGKTVIRVDRDVPGFVWNRLQFALIRECLHLLNEGIADVKSIDAAVSDGLAPRWLAAGPLATADLGGQDTFSRVANQLFGHLAASQELASILEELAITGRSFYRWDAPARQNIADIRRRALEFGTQISMERTALFPEAEEGIESRKEPSTDHES